MYAGALRPVLDWHSPFAPRLPAQLMMQRTAPLLSPCSPKGSVRVGRSLCCPCMLHNDDLLPRTTAQVHECTLQRLDVNVLESGQRQVDSLVMTPCPKKKIYFVSR